MVSSAAVTRAITGLSRMPVIAEQNTGTPYRGNTDWISPLYRPKFRAATPMSRKRRPSSRTRRRISAAVRSTSPRGVRAEYRAIPAGGAWNTAGSLPNRWASRKDRAGVLAPSGGRTASTWLGMPSSWASRSREAPVRRAGEKIPAPPSSSSRWSQVRAAVTLWACRSSRRSSWSCWGVKSVKPSSQMSVPAAQAVLFSLSAARVSRSRGSQAIWAASAS